MQTFQHTAEMNTSECSEQNFLKIKGHKHNIFSLRIGRDKMRKSVLTSSQHQYHVLNHNVFSATFREILLPSSGKVCTAKLEFSPEERW